MKSGLAFTLALLALATGGCASRQVAGPARTIGADVSSLGADLSRLQDDLRDYQGATHARSEGHLARADTATAAARQRQTEWKLVDAASTTEALDALLDQARAEADRLAAPASASAPPKVELPVKPLAKVAKGVDEVARPKTRREEIAFLIRYAGEVNDQLAKVNAEKGANPAP